MAELRDANTNPWYVLMTLYGDDLDKNRKAWNAWACQGLSDEEAGDSQLHFESTRGWASIVDEVTELHRSEMKRRNPESGFEYHGLPDLSQVINCSNLEFHKDVDVRSFVFLKMASFNKSIFLKDAFFADTQFREASYFLGGHFKGHAYFEGANFSNGVQFTNAFFEQRADFTSLSVDGEAAEASYVGAQFNGSSDFIWSVFEGRANFSRATFKQRSVFGGATFEKSVSFSEAEFEKLADFSLAKFRQSAEFDRVKFNGFSKFRNVQFFGENISDETRGAQPSKIDFTDCHFDKPTSFRAADFGPQYPIFAGAVMHSNTEFTVDSDKKIYWPIDPKQSLESARKSCAKIRHAIAQQGLPEEEHFFFRKEMEFARLIALGDRNQRWPYFRSWVCFQAWPYWIFKVFSGYGESIARPVEWLCGVFGFGLGALLGYFANVLGVWTALRLSAGISFSNLLPLFGFGRTFLKEELAALPAGLQFLSGAQTVIALPLLFFLGLALRKRFRLR